jgi:hypothetical protein
LTTDTDTQFAYDALTFFTSPPGGAAVTGLVPADRFGELVREGALAYEAVRIGAGATFDLRVAHNEIHIYTWGDDECCLPEGATSAVLVDVLRHEQPQPEAVVPARMDVAVASPHDSVEVSAGDGERALSLKPGDVVIFEEVKGPITGAPADADARHRHAVRITRVRHTEDPLHGMSLLEISWGEEDALPFSVCVSSRGEAPSCELIEDVSVLRGNVILVDHGHTTGPEDVGTVEGESSQYSCEVCVVGESEPRPKPFTAVLSGAPLTFAEPIPHRASASSLTGDRDSRRAVAQVFVDGLAAGATVAAHWMARRDLLASERDERHVAVEIDEDGLGHLRFGDGDLGAQPTTGTVFTVMYRVGNGPVGNVGPDTITGITPRTGSVDGIVLTAWNPLPATGGTIPETEEEVRRLAPQAYRSPIMRAIIPADYETIAERHRKVQRAGATLRWTGSWYEAQVAIDEWSSVTVAYDVLEAIRQLLYPPRRIGHDLRVLPAQTVPLDIVLDVCVDEDYLRGHVEAELREVFSNRVLTDGTLGFFHPDRLTFGTGVYVSALVSAAQAVTGVTRVRVTRLVRMFELPPSDPVTIVFRRVERGDAIEEGVLALSDSEIARVDSDRTFPDRGRITFEMRGGR